MLVDDWYKDKGQAWLGRTVGAKPDFSDSEVLTLMLSMDYLEFSSERRFLCFIRANYLKLFPQLVDQSQFNRRARSLRLLLNQLRVEILFRLGAHWENYFLIDTTPVIAVGYRRDKSKSWFFGSANYGYCAARKLKYYGYKLVLLCTLDGLPWHFELVKASTDEREAADEILDSLAPGSQVFGDKGFIGEDWQNCYAEKGIQIWTTKRENQEQNPKLFDRILNSIRERIEGLFDQLKEGGRSVEKTLAKTITGLCSRVIAKITALTFRYYLKSQYKINTFTYSMEI